MPWQRWSDERAGIALAVLAAFGFSFKAILVKLAYAVAPIDAVTLLTLRMGFALPMVLWVTLVMHRQAPPLKRQDWGLLALLGLLGYYGASILDFMGLQFISSGLERLILFTYPTITVLLGVFLLGQTLQRRQVQALVLSYVGIGLAFAHDLGVAGNTTAVVFGSALVLGSAVSYALYSAGSEVAVKRLGSLRFSALAISVSAMASLVHFAVSHPLSTLQQPPRIYAYGAAMALFSTVLPVFWQSSAVRRIGSARAALIGTLGPMLTLFFGWALLAEPISAPQLAGAALVLCGVWQVSRPTAAPKPSPALAADVGERSGTHHPLRS
ncbi:DMT family transporter [Aquabacterium sp.]|uniref:DMT family transporter n=1 Tax=Aquabacterium sp. TaxID=1872578 RepID=UPI0025BF3254|nr:DMT family transporter [Aquabacterium sp.]